MKPRSALLIVVLASTLGACARNASPFLTWTLAESDRPAIRNATTSEEKDIDADYTGTDAELTLQFHVHGKTAMVAFTDEGQSIVQRAPIRLEIMATDAKGYSLAPVQCMGPHPRGMQPDPETLALLCIVRATKENTEHLFQVWAHANGKVDAGKLEGML